jgi:hypothetical protein
MGRLGDWEIRTIAAPNLLITQSPDYVFMPIRLFQLVRNNLIGTHFGTAFAVKLGSFFQIAFSALSYWPPPSFDFSRAGAASFPSKTRAVRVLFPHQPELQDRQRRAQTPLHLHRHGEHYIIIVLICQTTF